MRELCCYLLIPELPLEHRSGSVSRSAPCTGTVQPADRKARLASHKEANIEENFLSQRGFVRRTRSNPLSWQGTVTNTHTAWPTLGNAWWIGIWFLRHTCMQELQQTARHIDARTRSHVNKYICILFFNRQRDCDFCSVIKTQLLNGFGR